LADTVHTPFSLRHSRLHIVGMEEQRRPRRKKFILWPLLIAGVIAGYQYFSSQKYVNPETGRAARVALSEGQEETLGLQSYQEVLSQSRVITSGPEVDIVRRVMQRLVAGTGETGQSFEWHVSVVQDEQANAFCLPGGKMVVYTGILPIARTEAGLATVLGHEMAHATSRHGSQRLFQNQIANTLMTGAQASLALGDMDPQQRVAVMAALGAGAKFGVLLPFSRDHESEADEVGLLYMARAGYDPREAIGFWERMGEAAGRQQTPEFASTHPSHGTRIERLKAHMPQAEQEYAKAQRRNDLSRRD
jgi:metalloendopeptidase OMA1, mitochondrial